MKNITVEITQDEEPLNPREDAIGSCLGRMYCWHRRYNLGDKKPEGYTPEDFEAEYNKDNSVMLPLFLYDHSGITMRTGNFRGIDPGGWDSGQVGWIVVTMYKIAEEGITIEKAKEILESEVKVYDQYLTGDVYAYVVEKTTVCKHCKEVKTEVVDSCGNFYGRDVKENGMLENIDRKYRKALKEAE
jgi:hypothetical protein